MTLTEFLLARLDEEKILTKWASAVRGSVVAGAPEEHMRGLACVYEDHPDYNEEWRAKA